jgi:iron-sulfur cluster assembly accessory protein
VLLHLNIDIIQSRQCNNFMIKDRIQFTESALEHFRNVSVFNNALGVRLSLAGGGCAGFSYKWDLVKNTEELVEDDFPQEYTDWTFWLDRPSELYLIGSTVNKKVDIIGSVIEIKAPLASSSCGCGESINFNL